MSCYRPIQFGIVVAAFALLGVESSADAKPKKPRPQQVAPTGAEDRPSAAPENPAVEAALDAMTSRSSEGLVQMHHGDGTVSMDLEGRFMHVVFAAPTDGAPTLACHTGDEARVQARTTKVRTTGKARTTARKPAAPALEVK